MHFLICLLLFVERFSTRDVQWPLDTVHVWIKSTEIGSCPTLYPFGNSTTLALSWSMPEFVCFWITRRKTLSHEERNANTHVYKLILNSVMIWCATKSIPIYGNLVGFLRYVQYFKGYFYQCHSLVSTHGQAGVWIQVYSVLVWHVIHCGTLALPSSVTKS